MQTFLINLETYQAAVLSEVVWPVLSHGGLQEFVKIWPSNLSSNLDS